MPGSRITRGAHFEFTTQTVDVPNGRCVPLDIARHPGAAAVVAFLGSGRVLLIRQRRHAASCELIEVPHAKLDPGESPESCAREGKEETGYHAGRIGQLPSIPLRSLVPSIP